MKSGRSRPSILLYAYALREMMHSWVSQWSTKKSETMISSELREISVSISMYDSLLATRISCSVTSLPSSIETL